MSIVVCTHEEGNAQEVLELALEHSLDQKDDLVVVDLETTGGPASSTRGVTLLGPEELDVLGHHTVAAALREASSLGIPATAFSAEGMPDEEVASFVVSHNPRLVLLSADESALARSFGPWSIPVRVPAR